ncbi:single-stranded DNA-binding protein [Acrocarpospora phusangensis]|uniref:Single-stranded DNA-binding protein n=1 Tax=Acrocarpospora phusangensis TaxID=1070424 RepID=A0A919QKE6_9ACTN|nr:single-stranded DNA-binding protein [Acrocarpospora phusangensis]GIH27940.1 single-stranded DNA-binding protein [Acrocarpospora phusangensis]
MSGETTITIIGNLTADPDLHYTQQGVAVAGFTIASTARTYNKQIEKWEDGDALFLRCSAWRDLGEHVCESLRRGSRVIASGRLRQRTYETSEGENRTVVELTVDEIGPSLRFANCEAKKAGRTNSGGTRNRPSGDGNDPWASTSNSAFTGNYTGDEPPF